MKGPLFKWFGSKWLASKGYPNPRHPVIVEPFAGSAGYACRHATHSVFLRESNPMLVDLWTWLIEEATSTAILDIPIGVPEGTDIRGLGLSDGQALLLKHWQRTNNYGACWTISPWGDKPGQWTANTRARVADEVHEVKHWSVGDWHGPATWFIDPPYQYNYQYGCKPTDYAALGQWVRGLDGQVIVCEARCPKTDRIPDWLPFTDFASRITSRRKEGQHTHSREVAFIR